MHALSHPHPLLLDAPSGPLVGSRVQLIDTLRALALSGVIVMNVTSMVMNFRAEAVMASAGPADMVSGLADLVLLQGKARSCFAFLFGVGFGVMLLRAQSGGRAFGAFYLRRMAALFAFGVFNQLFLFWGDILATYALLGALLVLFRDWSDRALLITGLSLVIVVPVLHGVLEIINGAPLPSLAGVVASAAEPLYENAGTVYAQSSYGTEVVAANLQQLALRWRFETAYMVVYVLSVFGLFLLGLLTARRAILFDVEAHRPLLRRVAWTCVPAGLLLSMLHASINLGWKPALPISGVVTASYVGLPLLAFGYIAALALLLQRRGDGFKRMLAPVGRMALTNYLASGALGGLFLYGYGLGMMDRLGMAQINLVAVALFLLLTAFSHAWLRYFRHGPAEWLWRSLSYGRVQPLRALPAAG